MIVGQCELLRLRGGLTPADLASLSSIERAAEALVQLADRAGDLAREVDAASR